MKKFLCKRIAISILIFLIVTVLVYILSSLAPGSVLDQYVTAETSAEDAARLSAYLGLDQPVYIQYLKWLSRMLRGDLGHSFSFGGPVITLIRKALGPTFLLAGCSLLTALIIALPLGIMSAYKPYSVWDHIGTVIAYIGTAIPSFFLGLTGVYFLALKLQWLPTSGLYSASGARSAADTLRHLILPVLVVSLEILGVFLRQTRSSMLEIYQEEYVKMARAKGLSEIEILLKYVFRNAAIPVVTSVGLTIPVLLSGVVVVEQLFVLPGIGKLLMQSILSRDYPVIMAIAVFISAVVLIVNIVLDIVYSLLDPRIRVTS